MTRYFEQRLGEGEVKQVLAMIARKPGLLHALIGLVSDPEAKINARLGAGVIFEEYQGKFELLAGPDLGGLTRHSDPRVRSDACHYLSLTHDASVRQYIEPLLDDDHEEVREVAEESLAALNGTGRCARIKSNTCARRTLQPTFTNDSRQISSGLKCAGMATEWDICCLQCVLLPFKDAARTIGECIESILAQSLTAIEIIAVK